MEIFAVQTIAEMMQAFSPRHVLLGLPGDEGLCLGGDAQGINTQILLTPCPYIPSKAVFFPLHEPKGLTIVKLLARNSIIPVPFVFGLLQDG